jgi:hypothetical protein
MVLAVHEGESSIMVVYLMDGDEKRISGWTTNRYPKTVVTIDCFAYMHAICGHQRAKMYCTTYHKLLIIRNQNEQKIVKLNKSLYRTIPYIRI